MASFKSANPKLKYVKMLPQKNNFDSKVARTIVGDSFKCNLSKNMS